MLIKPAAEIRSSEITDKAVYLNRRAFIRAAAGAAVGAAAAATAGETLLEAKGAAHGRKLENIKKGSSFNTTDKLNSWEDITSYNNYYEFGTDKDAPAEMARNFKTEPWKVTVDGECNKK